MISRKELNPNNVKLSPAGFVAFERLFSRINDVRRYYGKPMTVSSGIRSYLDQMRIDKAAGRSPRYGSMHIKGAAVDIYDADGSLWTWCMDNAELLQKIGVWLEDKRYTPTWVHFQVFAPVSGHFVFIPYAGPIPTTKVYFGPDDKYKPENQK